MIWDPFACGIMIGIVLGALGIMAAIECVEVKQARHTEEQARRAARNKRLHDLGVPGY